ncbi:hypothetical protein LIER_35054 [Lithospermum erythrorhizon]|uniref:Uncharacterized protein n=1 Tax=Lithospermum erythrorhizon TaxID=34254 RepID=A0AAV3NJJ6_LITER
MQLETFALRYQAYCASMIRISSLICLDDNVYCYFMKEVNDVLKRVEERVNSTSRAADPVSIGSKSTGNNDLEVQSRLQSAKGIKKRNNANKSKYRLKPERELANERLKANRSKAIKDQLVSKFSNYAVDEGL